ncbi:MAG: Fpg/Nei family DNA glycosylase [Myxococcales bacterium]
MPEGHTIHRLAQDLERDLAGHAVAASSPQGRFADAERLDGRALRGTEAVGKHLLLRFGGGAVVHVHLGLFGRFYRRRNPAPEPRATTRLRLVGPAFTWDLVGPTCCERMTIAALRALRARLGADPLAKQPDIEASWTAVRATRRPIGAVLLDQRVLAGIGNVYRAELLFLLGLHPETPARDLDRATFQALWEKARALLALGVKERRIVTVPHPEKTRVKRGEALYVYRRRTCRVCGAAVSRLVIGGRPIYLCERCQPRRKSA